MSEETKDVQAVNETVETNSVEEAPTSEVSEETTASRTEVTDEQEVAHEEVNNSESSETSDSVEQPKESRAERRIRQLVDKNKELHKKVEDLATFSSEDTPFNKKGRPEPLITQDEMETGVDPTVLEQRIEQRIADRVHKELANKERVNRYERDVSNAIKDLENTVESIPELNEESDSYDPAFADAFLNIYNDTNYVNGAFIPRRQASEIAKSLRNLADRKVTRETAKITGKMAQQAQGSVVAPTTTKGDDQNYAYEQAYETALQSGDEKDWAKVIKFRTSKPE